MNIPDAPTFQHITLDDKYSLSADRAFMTGIEALVRLPLIQHQRDLDAGLNTAGFISGYRGSPLGTLDRSLVHAKEWLDQRHIKFQPGVNEDIAATSVWGTQQVHLLPGAKYDGVFSMWYGKGPGVDRSMDPIKHANLYGTTKYGGVLAIAGDDHACKSSTISQQSEHMFIGASIPILNPANVQDVLDYGIYGWALSRFSGCWVAIKAITENMDSAVSADLNPNRVVVKLPTDVKKPEGGLNAQWPSTPQEQEGFLNQYRIFAARDFALTNNLNTIEFDSPEAKIGIVTSGKSYLDVMEALNQLDINDELATAIGIRIYKVGMSWPLEPVSTRRFAKGLKEILVVEEKRSVVEDQIIVQLYDLPSAHRPVVVGELDEKGMDLVTNLGELTPAMVAKAIGKRILQFHPNEKIRNRLEFIEAKEAQLSKPNKALNRTPYFCSGCPHNSSTKIPEGSIGLAGIGCHYMVKWMDRKTDIYTHMGGEGGSWIGQAPFTDTKHVFQNIGDGTYFHSGILAIRAAIASGVNITYKILYNDAVALTGGQPVDGNLKVVDMAAQLLAEGVNRLAVVAEDFEAAKISLRSLTNITIHPKSEFDQLQEDIRKIKGTSIIIFDQTCAAEKRRRRKRGTMAENPTRVFIHPDICEGCGDCSTQSNCLSVLPKKTELGTKRQIDQSACNKDFGCLKGFCPSFITITGGEFKPGSSTNKLNLDVVLTEPVLPKLKRPWNILVTGIGGTGVLTVGSLVAMAAHLEGKGCSTLNQTGLAQKFGSVICHVRVGQQQKDILAVRVPEGNADLLLGCDLVVSANAEALGRLDINRSHSVINSYENITADFIHDENYEFPAKEMESLIKAETGESKTHFVNATRIAQNLLGDSIASNLFLLGYAYQLSLIPVSESALFKAIELNAVKVEFNQQAFTWGRRAAVNLEAVEVHARDDESATPVLEEIEDVIQWRYRYLIKYQNKYYADQYLSLLGRVKKHDHSREEENLLLKAVALSYFKLLAYKDEYEIARLFSDTDYLEKIKSQINGDFDIKFHMAPPLFSKRDKLSGHLIKRQFPKFTEKLFPLLAKMKFLRGSWFDVFGKTEERKIERNLIVQYEDDIKVILGKRTKENRLNCIALAELPIIIKGFGHIKLSNITRYQEQREALRRRLKESELSLVVSTSKN